MTQVTISLLFSEYWIIPIVPEVESVELRSPTLNDVFLKFAERHIARKQGQDEDEDDSEGGFMERYAQYGNK